MGRSIRREASPSLLQRSISERKAAPVRLADASNPTFRPLHTALDKRYRELHAQGVGTKRKQAEVVSNHEEQQLWERGVISSEPPSGLLRAILFEWYKLCTARRRRAS